MKSKIFSCYSSDEMQSSLDRFFERLKNYNEIISFETSTCYDEKMERILITVVIIYE